MQNGYIWDMEENIKISYEAPRTDVLELEQEGLVCISGQWGLRD